MLGKVKGRRKGWQRMGWLEWHHWLNGHEFEQTLGDGKGRGNLEHCTPWDHKESDMTEWLNNNKRSSILLSQAGVPFGTNVKFDCDLNWFFFQLFRWVKILTLPYHYLLKYTLSFSGLLCDNDDAFEMKHELKAMNHNFYFNYSCYLA